MQWRAYLCRSATQAPTLAPFRGLHQVIIFFIVLFDSWLTVGFLSGRYIEGLQNQNRYISNWDKSLRANTDNTAVPDASRLPTHWLGPLQSSDGSSPDVVSALWMLRDHMMKDAFNVAKLLN